ncbi:hypothetical protein FA09DRAFT_341173 [Tilletiopsis washingtonensis]|uniref:VWFA domain-containing protein n=1 Tax=Tilletiopsis washingtonensis TaxID=58919 RepID=A0A316Z173_9BASI|nr:hypothetical protein FA09DRAFT_341173 [Tilletiopsis washingtonensis]PWN95530.1 hypothetical protein FA09DRAFT_341173 [Tilletiopsis washingtonensis]
MAYPPPSGPPPAYAPLGNSSAPSQQAPYPPASAGYPPPQGSYAPPAGPPPGHQPYGGAPGVASPAAYAPTNPFADSARPASSAPVRQNSVLQHAGRLSGAGAAGAAGGMNENALELLRSFDTILLVDDSSSMQVTEQPDGTHGPSRWEQARDALAGLVEIAMRYDEDGVDIHFLNASASLQGCRDPAEVRALFDRLEPNGITPTGDALELLLLQYMDDIETARTKKSAMPKKRNYLVITDGRATDDPESVIVATARRLDSLNAPLTQIGIQFVQVGADAEAKAALEELDDALSNVHRVRDIVDTVPYAGMALDADLLVKALLGGINRRLDRQK